MAQKASPAASSPCLMITSDDIHLFSEGAWQRGWEKMGAHPDVQNGVEGWRFCIWAPDVTSVHVIGEFNEWNPEAHAMFPIEKSGLWQCFVAGAEKGQLYKYLIETRMARSYIKLIRMPSMLSALRVRRPDFGPSMAMHGKMAAG